MPDTPYRVYRGGSGPHDSDPDLGPITAQEREPDDRGPVVLPPREQPPAAKPRRPRGPRIRRIVAIVLGVLLVAFVAWIVVGYLAFRSSVAKANERLQKWPGGPAAVRALTPQHGLGLSDPVTILVLGADKTGHSDSIQLVRTDPGKHLVATLAIPRDLRVPIAGHGEDKINQAYADGGPALALRTIEQVTGVPVNHLVLINFTGFRRLVDAVGGVDIVSPEKIVSSFGGHTYRFRKGHIHLNGHEALVYSRVRKNALNPADSDVTRGLRQQQVMAALRHKLATPSTLLRLRSVGSHAADPLSTDLSANQLLSLGWVDFRAQRHLTCHLGGVPQTIGQVSYLLARPENSRVLAEFLGQSAPQPVSKNDPYAPSCVG
jgi:polyisoprenyl-teichoic acid--peptidoglycan teichoic acid transferase